MNSWIFYVGIGIEGKMDKIRKCPMRDFVCRIKLLINVFEQKD